MTAAREPPNASCKPRAPAQRKKTANAIIRPMSLKITELCVNCDVCEPVCPNAAIAMGPEIYEITPRLCTECVGHYDSPQCVDVCPVECIILDPAHAESEEQLLAKFTTLAQEKMA